MTQQNKTYTVRIELPDDLYQRIREVAEREGKTIEAVIVEGLQWMYITLPQKVELKRDSDNPDQTESS